MAEETKIIYHVDDEETPYLVKIPKPPDQVTLLDFKTVINRPNYKFFFKSMDDDFGVVKEEIVDEDANLPCFNGRVVSWVVPPDEDGVSVHSGDGMFNPVANVSRSSTIRKGVDNSDAESITSRRSSRSRASRRYESDTERRSRRHRDRYGDAADGASVMSSDIETTSFVDSDEESQMSSATETSRYVGGQRKRRRRRQRMPRVERCSSFSTITESTMSLNIITVTLNMDKINFLGISIVGQANKKGDGGIYVGSVMKGGAVDADGRIEPGDMILAVGDVNFENMSNDDAVRVLRECVHKPGPITLTVAKCWDPSPKGYFTVPKNDVTRPIDPAAWLQHSEQVRASGGLLGGTGSPSMSTMTSTSDSLTSSIPEADRYFDHPDLSEYGLTKDTDMHTIVKVMATPESGLVVRDRMWLKITIPNAFIGSDLVDWLFAHVEGFQDRRDARKFASKLLKAGLIRHTVNKITFSEQCYYVFGDLTTNHMKGLTLQDIENGGGDTIAPLSAGNAPSQMGTWSAQMPPNYMMTPGHSMPAMQAGFMAIPSADGGPPNYQQVFPQMSNVYPAFNPYFAQHPGSIAPSSQGIPSNHTGSGSNHSGSLKGSLKGVQQQQQQRDIDQVTIRSSGSSERSHSSKGSKREANMNDKTSLISFQMDNMSLRSDTESVRSLPMVQAQMIPPGAQVMMPNTQIIQLPTGQMMALPTGQMVMQQQPPPMQQHHSNPNSNPGSNPQSGASSPAGSTAPTPTPPQEPPSNLESMQSTSLSASRQSFRMAMGNTDNEFFVDVM